jgi:predicted nucleotidyltransferase
MDNNEVLNCLRTHQTELRQLGAKSLAVFGSVARGEAGPDSDVDILVEIAPPVTFDRYIQIKFYLEDLLKMPVDLVTPQAIKPRLKPYIEREAIRVA